MRGASLRDVARQFGVSRDATHRHRSKCMKTAMIAVEKEQRVLAVADAELAAWNAFNEMMWLRRETHQLYREFRGDPGQAAQDGDEENTPGDPRLALATLAEIRQQTKLFSELLSGAEEAKQAEREQEWNAIREAIFMALEPFPDARLAVARALLAVKEQEATDGRIVGY